MLHFLAPAKPGRVFGLLLLLAVSPRWEGLAVAQQALPSHSQWRRTAAGWERSELWQGVPAQEVIAPQTHSAPHPAIVAALIACIAIAALRRPEKHPAAYRGPDRRRSDLRHPSETVPSGSLL